MFVQENDNKINIQMNYFQYLFRIILIKLFFKWLNLLSFLIIRLLFNKFDANSL